MIKINLRLHRGHGQDGVESILSKFLNDDQWKAGKTKIFLKNDAVCISFSVL